MSAAHQRPRPGDDRQIRGQAFERAVATGPADAVEEYVADAGDADEIRGREPRQQDDVPGRVDPLGAERAEQTAAEPFRDLVAARRGDEDELGVVDLARDAG